MDLDVWGFGQIYKYLKRIETRRQLNMVSMLRTAPNATVKQYKDFLKSLDIWLPVQERDIEKGNQDDFNKLVARGGL
jgi:ATP-dependent protease Clp ATPase subunit